MSFMAVFETHYEADESWDGKPSDVPKELKLLSERKNDTYPQGRDNCKKFLEECQGRGYNFKIWAKHTKPYWTWYYEIELVLPASLSEFTKKNKADETWEGKPSDVPKEIKLLNDRKNDTFPQGRDNCLKFLKECEKRGLNFKIKAVHTSPYWTWYYETKVPKRSLLPFKLAAFEGKYDADEKWKGTPADVPKELKLLADRKNDTFPQGRDNCKKFLEECQARGFNFKIRAKHTSPYWTWYYEVAKPKHTLPGNLRQFEVHFDCDEKWDGNASSVPKELKLLADRKNDTFPQGRDNCKKFLEECQAKGYKFKIKAVHTSPYWTWYYELDL